MPIRLSNPMPPRNILHIGVELLAQISDFVDEGDLGRQERIGCVLD